MKRNRHHVTIDDFVLSLQENRDEGTEKKRKSNKGAILRTPHDHQGKQLELNFYGIPRNLIQVSKKLNDIIAGRIKQRYKAVFDGLTREVFNSVNQEMGDRFFLRNALLVVDLRIRDIYLIEKDAIVEFSLVFNIGHCGDDNSLVGNFLSRLLEKVTGQVLLHRIEGNELNLEVLLNRTCCAIKTVFFDQWGRSTKMLYVAKDEFSSIQASGGDCLIVNGEVVELPKNPKQNRIFGQPNSFDRCREFVMYSSIFGGKVTSFPLSREEHNDLVNNLGAGISGACY